MTFRILLCALLFISLFIPTVFATWTKKPEFRWMQLYHYDSRRHNHHLYTNRLSSTFNCIGNNKKSLFKLTPFFEIRRNVAKGLWERKELGVEIGKDIFSWLYLGEGIQKGWMKEDYRLDNYYEKRDYLESETRLMLNHALLANKHVNLKGYLLEEYTYDFDKGAGMRNDIVLGLAMPVAKFIEIDIDWRHIDRVHYYDCDALEASLTLIF